MNSFRIEFKQLRSWIKSSQTISISTHILPDGDGLGAESALYHYLSAAGKRCQIINPDPLPRRYQFLDAEGKFMQSYTRERAESFRQEFYPDLWMILDTNDPRRVAHLWEMISPQAKRIVFFDHHPDQPGVLSSENWSYPPHAYLLSDPLSSSIGELLYHLFLEANLTELNSKIAQGLYVSVMTDTNSFRYARTTPAAHRIAAEMIELGINPEEIYQNIYSSKEVSHLKLLGHMLQRVEVSPDKKIAWLEMDLPLRQQYQASADDTLSFLNLLLLLKDAEVVCFFREEEDHRIRVSIKSKGQIVVNQIAMELGGGGHEFAAGLALKGNMKEVVKMVIGRFSP